MANKVCTKKGVSPVISTVILVAVAITVAVAVAYWMSGIASQYTRFEKVEIQSAYSQKFETASTEKGWRTIITLQNTGSAEATLIDCFINDAPLTQYGVDVRWYYDDSGTETLVPVEGISMVSGGMETFYLYIISHTWSTQWDPTPITFTSGTTINLKLHSASGMDYIKLVQLT